MKHVLAALALLLGLGAAVAGARPSPPEPIAARELAQAVREHRPGLTVVDLRGPVAAAPDALPGAVDHLPKPAAGPVVLYGPEPRVRSAAAELRARGARDLRLLEGGADAWRDEVLSPVLPPDLARWTDEERRIAELSAWFGGAPRTSADTPAPEPGRRRGC